MTTTELKFENIKQDLITIVGNTLKMFLKDKENKKKDPEDLRIEITNEIIKTLHGQERGFKFICNCILFPKKGHRLSFSSNCLWNQRTDGSIKFREDNEQYYCFVCLFGVAP